MLLGRLLPPAVRTRRALTAGLCAAVIAVPAVVAVVTGEGYRASDLALSGGGAWLASPSVGLVTLVDGASEQVAASLPVPVGASGDVAVTQAGASAYVADSGTGTVTRVDGAVYEPGAPTLFAEPGGGLEVIAGNRTFVLDVGRRIASVVDPQTLQVREEHSLAARPGRSQSVVDGRGRLWVVDSDGGGLTWLGADKGVAPDVAGSEDRLVLVDGDPVLVDVDGGRVGRVGDDGDVGRWTCLDVRPGDDVELIGSSGSGAASVHAVVEQTGTLVRAGLDGDDCGSVVVVGRPGDTYGALARSGRFVFVPNRATGTTYVVDTAADVVAAEFPLAEPGHQLELVPEDGLVFYNDLDSEVAGVLSFRGGTWVRGEAIRKYDPADPGADVVAPEGEQGPAPAATDPGQEGDPVEPGVADPGAAPPPGGVPPTAGARPPQDGARAPGSGRPGTGSPEPPGPPAAPVVTGITATPGVVEDGEVTFTGQVAGAAGAWQWTVLDGTGATTGTSTASGSFTYQMPAGFSAGDALDVRLVVGGSAPYTEPFIVGAKALVATQTTVTATPADASTAQRVDLAIQVTAAGGTVPSGSVDVVFEVPAEDPTTQTWGTFDLVDGAVLVDGRQFPDPGTVTAVVTYVPDDGEHAASSGTDTVNVTDGCHLEANSPIQLDVRAVRSVDTARVRLVDCVGGESVTWDRPGWVGTRGGGGDANEMLDIDQAGTAPVDGANPAALTASLPNGSQVSFDVLANNAPVWNGYAECIGFADPTTFYADFEDADLSSLTVRLTVGATTHTMAYTGSAGGAHGEFFWLEWPQPQAAMADVDTWTVQATDAFGLVSDIGTGDRQACW